MNPRNRNYVVATTFLILSLLFVNLPSAGARESGSDLEKVDYLSSPEKDLAREINLVRSNPQQYAAYLEQSKKYYKGKDYQPPGKAARLTTVEGVSAVDEAIAALRATKPMPSFALSKGMTLAARDHVKDLGRTGNTGHKGTDGSSTEARCNRYGSFSNGIGENIVYQTDSPREVVIGWLVDDGVASRGHRRNLLSANYRYIGVAVGDRTDFGSMCVLTFAGSYAEMLNAPGKNKTAARKF